MTEQRAWYREPETFIAIAALIVSVTAVVVGLYEASLQRAHDRAEVWPHLEVSTWVNDSSVEVRLDNTGLGPAIVRQMAVTVDGRPQRNWDDALHLLYGHDVPPHGTATSVEHSFRPGDRGVMFTIPVTSIPRDFWTWIRRVTVRVCYTSVFESTWIVTDTLGKSDHWESAKSCPIQQEDTDL